MTFGCSWQISYLIIGDSLARRKANLKIQQQILPTLSLSSTLFLPFFYFFFHCFTTFPFLSFVSFNRFIAFAPTVAHLKQRTPPEVSRVFVRPYNSHSFGPKHRHTVTHTRKLGPELEARNRRPLRPTSISGKLPQERTHFMILSFLSHAIQLSCGVISYYHPKIIR